MDMAKYIGETTEYDKKQEVERRKVKSWLKSVSAFANGSGGCLLFGIADDDPRRLAGAVEEALYGAFDAGHTCVSGNEVSQRISRLLGAGGMIDRALAEAEARGCFLRRADHLHAPGPYVMEYGIAESIAQRAARPESLLNHGALAALLALFSIKYLVDQVVLGVVLNLLASGITGFLFDQLIQPNSATLNAAPQLPRVTLKPLSRLRAWLSWKSSSWGIGLALGPEPVGLSAPPLPLPR